MKCRILDLTDRAAMGLPEGFARGPLGDLEPLMDRLRFKDREDLALLAEAPNEPLSLRYAAATLLGMMGDIRIDTREPAMCDVPAGLARVGLETSQIERVVGQWEHVGVVAPWIEKEAPDFTAIVPSFRIGRYPITNTEFREFLEDTNHPELPTSWRLGAYPVERSNHPVHTVSSQAAEAYAAWLSKETGRRFRLASEVEWEYAAAGPDAFEYPWGDQFAPERLNTAELAIQSTTPVGIFPGGRSWIGADDLGGNVEEYVADDYRPYWGGSLISDDLVTTLGSYRVTRGGSFARFGDLARCKRRHGAYPKEIYAIGFRVAESP